MCASTCRCLYRSRFSACLVPLRSVWIKANKKTKQSLALALSEFAFIFLYLHIEGVGGRGGEDMKREKTRGEVLLRYKNTHARTNEHKRDAAAHHPFPSPLRHVHFGICHGKLLLLLSAHLTICHFL